MRSGVTQLALKIQSASSLTLIAFLGAEGDENLRHGLVADQHGDIQRGKAIAVDAATKGMARDGQEEVKTSTISQQIRIF